MIQFTMSYPAAYHAALWISMHTMENNDPMEVVSNVWDDANSDTIGAIITAIEEGGTVAEIDRRLYDAVQNLPNRTLDGYDVYGWAEEALERVAAGEDLAEMCEVWSETSDLHWGRPGESGPGCPALIPRAFSFAELTDLEMLVFMLCQRFGRRRSRQILDDNEVTSWPRDYWNEARATAAVAASFAEALETYEFALAA